MPAAKRQRGATAIREGQAQLPQLALPQHWPLVNGLQPGHLAAAAALLVGVVLVITVMPDLQTDDHAARALPETTAPEITAEATQVAKPQPDDQAPEPEPPWRDVIVRKGDNLSLIFKRAGFDNGDVHRVVSEASDGKSLAKIYPGQTIAFLADETGELVAVRHVKSPVLTVTYSLTEAGFESEVRERTPETRESRAAGEITSSLFLAGRDAGLSQNMIMELANIFGGVIDFVLDPRKGDTFHVIYDELYLDGEKFKDGAILAASFTNQGETFNAYRYQDSQGDTSYYNEDGVSMRKAFLLAPVDFTRISSNFNPNRLHPIYKTKRPHRGTDYAAPTGTPVFAAGDGRVSKAGYNRANGNYVFIQHGEQYVTKYLHLHKRRVKQGQRVSQSQVIGTVGATGAATGPHLHYEFLMNGVHRNPRTIHKKLPKAKSLPGSEMAQFRAAIQDVSVQLASLRSDNSLAMNVDASELPNQ
jgi:murein DD-endopeptidase MepM/ murein hydrolase activator NlpD